jgi:DNA-binding MarR family transcriptional regulator
MTTRKQKVSEVAEILHSLGRHMAMGAVCCVKMPRVTPSQWGVLMLLNQGDRRTVKDIAGALGITSSAATQLVDGLVVSGYVTRKGDTDDRRKVTLTLSRATKNHVTSMRSQVGKKLLEIFKVLSDKEFNQYLELNKKLAQGLPKKN